MGNYATIDVLTGSMKFVHSVCFPGHFFLSGAIKRKIGLIQIFTEHMDGNQALNISAEERNKERKVYLDAMRL